MSSENSANDSHKPTEKKTVKYMYVRDPEEPKRVVTIARRFSKNGNKIHYGIAVCKPDLHYDDYNHGSPFLSDYIPPPGDVFSKDIGRRIASGRLEKNPYKVALKTGESPVVTVMRDIAQAKDDTVIPKFVQVIAEKWLNRKNQPAIVKDGTHLSDLDLCEKCQKKVQNHLNNVTWPEAEKAICAVRPDLST